MPLPNEPVTLNVEQIGELKQKLANMRHEVNNNLSLIIAATEIIRSQPDRAATMLKGLAEKPQKIAEAVAQFSRELEAALQIRRE